VDGVGWQAQQSTSPRETALVVTNELFELGRVTAAAAAAAAAAAESREVSNIRCGGGLHKESESIVMA
jgi:hypothetical protein